MYYEIILYDRIYEEWHKKIELKPGFEVYLKLNEEINAEDLGLKVVNLITGDIEVLTLLFSDLTFVN